MPSTHAGARKAVIVVRGTPLLTLTIREDGHGREFRDVRADG
ncbi:hypothetical protein ABT294_19000 [Nonomuraea sp. NPDC000554]